MVEVEVQIRKILDLGVIPTPGAGQVPLLRGIASVSVSTLGPFLWLSRFYLFTMLMILCKVFGAVMASHGMPTHPWMLQGRRQDTPPMGHVGM
jgi:hypothetical protein